MDAFASHNIVGHHAGHLWHHGSHSLEHQGLDGPPQLLGVVSSVFEKAPQFVEGPLGKSMSQNQNICDFLDSSSRMVAQGGSSFKIFDIQLFSTGLIMGKKHILLIWCATLWTRFIFSGGIMVVLNESPASIDIRRQRRYAFDQTSYCSYSANWALSLIKTRVRLGADAVKFYIFSFFILWGFYFLVIYKKTQYFKRNLEALCHLWVNMTSCQLTICELLSRGPCLHACIRNSFYSPSSWLGG